MADLSQYTAKIAQAQSRSHLYSYSGDPRTGFGEALAGAGFGFKGFVDVDRLVRLQAPEDKPGKKSGWYWYTETEGIGIGVYGSWKGNPERETWCSKSPVTMTAEEKLIYARKMEEARVQRDEELKRRQERATARAVTILARAGYPANHEYLERKQIIPSPALRQSDNILIIPIEATDGKITSLQYIRPDGSKKLLSGGRIKGCFHKIEGKENAIYIVEGYATGVSIHMATKCTVYVAFNAGNLYEVAAKVKDLYSGSRIVIAGDDDQFTPSNPGKTKAIQAASDLNIESAFPVFRDLEGHPTDFNDLHCREGLAVVKKNFEPKAPAPYTEGKAQEEKVEELEPPIGFLRDVFNYYNTTSGNKQPGFAIQTAIAAASIILARRFKTDNENFSSVYLLNIGKSGTGKEHCKKVIGRIMRDSGKMDLMSGSGYSSGAAVMSALLDKPRHIAISDEFGRNLQAGKISKDANYMSANSKLMEAIGACDGFLAPLNYSTMALTKEKAKEFSNRFVHYPAITILAMTTPVTFFEAIDHNAIMDGFIGRFIISISNAKRDIRQKRRMIETPESILEWIRQADNRAGMKPDIASEVPLTVTVAIPDDAYAVYQDFERYCIEQSNSLEEMNLSEVNNRTSEMSLRLALIAALARDIQTETISLEDIRWSIAYVKNCIDKTIKALKTTIAGSNFESDKKAALAALRKLGAKGMNLSEMNKRQPFAKWKKKERDDILAALVEAELAHADVSTGTGRPTTRYYAI